jgi:hypothetical protein
MNAMNTVILTEAGTNFRQTTSSTRPGSLTGFTFAPRTLEQAVRDAVEEIEDKALHPLSTDSAEPFVQARAVLALLAGCYAQQIYSSASVAARAANDPDFPWLWWEALPNADAIRRFREVNRAALHHCLTVALRFQVEEKIAAGTVTKINLPQLSEEASRRIIMATFADSRELEAD